jgi:nicotinamide-nucleotide amidase
MSSSSDEPSARDLAKEGVVEAESIVGSASALSAEAVEVVFALGEQKLTMSVAESLTGGLVAASIVSVPGASSVFRGAVVAYATELKHDLLGVEADLLSANGPVDPDVALQMASGVRARLGTDWGLATTGVAGPGPSDGVPPGTVYVAVASEDDSCVRRLDLSGDRTDVRSESVAAVLALLLSRLRRESAAHGAGRNGTAEHHTAPSR